MYRFVPRGSLCFTWNFTAQKKEEYFRSIVLVFPSNEKNAVWESNSFAPTRFNLFKKRAQRLCRKIYSIKCYLLTLRIDEPVSSAIMEKEREKTKHRP